MSNNPAHVAADTEDSRLAAWIPLPGSPDADLLNELGTMTSRARDLVRNNPIASGVRQTLCDNIIGSQLRLSAQPQYRFLGETKDWAVELGNAIEDEFATWAESTECDITRTQTLLGLTVQALAGALVNGDSIGLMLWQERPDCRWATRIQVLEADRLQTPPWLLGNNKVRSGVEIDKYGAPVAYWFNKVHPGDQYGYLLMANQQNWERVPAFTSWGRRRVIHLYDKERPEQNRGKSIFAAVMREFKVAGEYLGAELQAAAANALIAAFLEANLDAESTAAIFGTTPDTATGYWKDVADKYNRKKMEGGMFLTLPVGTKLSGYNSNRPNTAFVGFMESILRHIAAGVNLPYELLLKDFSKTNYSSARAALLEAWRFFNSKRRWLQDAWLNPIYECWLEEAVDKKRIEAPGYYENRYAYRRGRWIFSGRGWVDPVKEANAAQLRITNFLTTLEQECAEQGLVWEEVMEQQAREQQKREELGLQAEVVDPNATTDPATPNPDTAEDDEGTGGDVAVEENAEAEDESAVGGDA